MFWGEKKVSKTLFVVLEGKVKDITTENKLCVIKTRSALAVPRGKRMHTHTDLRSYCTSFPLRRQLWPSQTQVSTPKSLQDPTTPKLAFPITHTNGVFNGQKRVNNLVPSSFGFFVFFFLIYDFII